MFGFSRFWPTAETPDDEPEDGPAIDWTRVQLQKSEFERRSERLERYAVSDDEPVSNVIALRFAPAKVQWTRAEPTVPGTYAVRVNGGPRRTVDVYADARGRMMASSCCVPEFAVARSGMEWGNQPYMDPE